MNFFFNKSAVALAVSTVCALSLSCGSATVETPPTSDNPKPADQAKSEVAHCFTNPEELARSAVAAAHDGGVEAVTASLTMNRSQLEKFMAIEGATDKAEAAWQIHRSELEGGIERIRECTDGSIALRGVDREDAPFEFYEANFVCTLGDGTQMYFKVKQAKLDGCLYVGYMG